MSEKGSLLSPRFEGALRYAAQLHAGHLRKGPNIPYIAHLLAVAALVLEDGGDEEQAIAALLHDAVEDRGGLETLDEIRARFGDEVAEIVLACSDAFEQPKPPWRARKEHHLERLRDASPAVRRVTLADKVHNARSMLRDLRREGESVWARFKGGRDGTLWYLREVLTVLGEDGGYLADELASLIEQIEAL